MSRCFPITVTSLSCHCPITVPLFCHLCPIPVPSQSHPSRGFPVPADPIWDVLDSPKFQILQSHFLRKVP